MTVMFRVLPIPNPGPTGNPPAPVTNLRLAQQGGPNNDTAPVSNSQKLTWTASVTPGATYNVYRNGLFLTNTASTNFTDSTATNSNPSNLLVASTPYAYTVKAIVGSVESAAATPGMYMYENGTNTNGSDLSYSGAILNFNGVDPAGSGLPVMSCTWPGGGGIQPGVSPPLAPGANGFANDGEIGAFASLTLDVYATDNQWQTNSLSVGVTSRIPVLGGGTTDGFCWVNKNLWAYGTPIVGQWVNFKIPLADLHITPLSVYGANGNTFTGTLIGSAAGIATLNVTAVNAPNFVDNTCFVIQASGGPAIPAGSWIQSVGSGGPPNGAGTYTVNGPNITTSTNISGVMAAVRYNWYKDEFQWGFNPANPTTYYFRNFGVLTN